MQEPCNAALARGRNDNLCAAAIDGMKIVFVRHPHTGKTGKVINLVDVAQGLIHQIRIKHRPFDILHFRQGAGWRAEIENSHLSTPRDERRYQMLADVTAAAGDKCPCHVCGCGSA